MNIGETITISLVVTTIAGAPDDPTGTPALYLNGPLPKRVPFTGTVVRDSVGKFHANFAVPEEAQYVGSWSYFWDLPGQVTGHLQKTGTFVANALLTP